MLPSLILDVLFFTGLALAAASAVLLLIRLFIR
jgi:hypothetical protein